MADDSAYDPPVKTGQLAFRKLVLLIATILAGIAIALVVLDQVFASIPTDIRRLGVLIEALETQEPSPKIVVFGNSAVMSGIDGRALTASISDQPLAWNCASTGQSLPEAYLLTQALPEEVETAIYGIFIQPGPIAEPLHPQKFNTLYMFGFRPSDETIATLDRIYGPPVSALLEKSRLAQIFASRWALRQFPDTQMRLLIRSDLTLAEAAVDLFHPQRYEKPIAASITASFIAERSEQFLSAPATLATGSASLAHQIAGDAATEGRETIFLFPPVHPDLLESHRPAIFGALKEFEESFEGSRGVHVISALDVLDREYFIDDVHPTNEGAQILTSHLAHAMQLNR